MLSRSSARLLTGAAVLFMVLIPGSRAFADDPWQPVDCTANPHAPGCTVNVGTPEKPGSGHGGDSGGSDSGSGAGGDDPCQWVKVDRPPPAGADPAGGWYMQVCGNDTSALGTPPQWIATPPAPVDPAVLARQASANLALPSPGIRVNPDPGHYLLVEVPIWLWLDTASWGAQSAAASVPGVSVTATARPTQVRWDMGDGTTVTCTGPGTPWRTGTDPSAPSPDCGHTYHRSSAGAAGAAFTVRATVTWSVSWAGGGTGGNLPELTTTSILTVRVAVSQAINGGTS